MRSRFAALTAAWLAIIILSGAFAAYYMNARHRYSGEAFLAFYCAGHAIDVGGNPYALEPLRTCEHTTDPSFTLPAGFAEPAPLPGYSLALFALLGKLPYAPATAVWYAMLAVALLLAALACARITGIPPPVVAAAFLAASFSGLFYGELVPLALLAIAAAGYFIARERPVYAAITGCSALVEPHIGVAVVLALLVFVPRARIATVCSCAALAALSFATLGIHENVEYFARVLPTQARAEVPALDQYSLTWVLHVLRVPDTLALSLGGLSYVLMLLAGLFAGPALARRFGAPALVVYAPPAFVLLGGSFVHDVQMVLALPFAFATVRYIARPLLGWAAIGLLTIPSAVWWGSLRVPLFTFSLLFIVATFAFAQVRAKYPPLQAAVAIAAGIVFIVAARHLSAAYTPGVLVALADPSNASVSWSTFIHTTSPAVGAPLRFIVGKLPTWTGLLAIVFLPLSAMTRGARPDEPEEPAPPEDDGPRKSPERMSWLDAAKGLAILWIVLNHVTERIFGGEFIGNPGPAWPSLGARAAQLVSPAGHGVLGWFTAVVRDLGWLGDQGVGMFLVLSGFGLTYGAAVSGHALQAKTFYRRRLLRIYPEWWGAHVLFAITGLLVGWGLNPFSLRTALSFLGIRFLPQTFYYFAPAWWYIGLLLQLYLLFPLLHRVARSRGPLVLLAGSALLCYAARAAGYMLPGPYVDMWERGAFFLTRLPEFTLGMAVAIWWARDAARTTSFLRSPSALGAAFVAFLAGNALSLTYPGMVVAPSILAAADTALAYLAVTYLAASVPRAEKALATIGRHSYAIYLVHQPVVNLAFRAAPFGAVSLVAGSVATIGGTAALTLLLERGTAAVVRTFAKLVGRLGTAGALAAAFSCVAVAYALLMGADALIGRIAPQEIEGWGERPSLQKSGQFGWTLKPSTSTRLRWETYDYTVTANALGFPGPDVPTAKAAGTYRIMTVGDAFTSAEGVDTSRSWPRLLEGMVAQRDRRKVEVLNFSITGYGPNQYDAVVRAYARRYHVDMIVIGMFVNDYGDALTTTEAFQRSIGFGRPAASGLREHLLLEQLRATLRLRIEQPLGDAFGKPNAEGYHLGNFEFFERNPPQPLWTQGVAITRARFASIETTAASIGAKVAIVLFPASIQVCGRDQLAYYPRSLDLADAKRFDPSRPQHVTEELAANLRIPYLDLRPALTLNARCVYASGNMHLTEEGQARAAQAVAKWLPR